MGLFVPWLADAARSTGYRVVEIAGWRTRGHGPMRLVEGVVGHHTGTPLTAPGDYPSLNVVTNGRAGLPGPLAPLGIGRDGTIYVIAGGLCYHAGASRWAGYLDLNDEFLGIEAESDGSGRWSPQQLDCYPKLVAALLRYMSRGVDRYAAHRDVAVPAGRKPDPTGIDSGWMRTTAQHHLTTGIPPLEDDMDANQDLMLRQIHEQLTKAWPSFLDGRKGFTLVDYARNLDVHANTIKVAVAELSDDEAKVITAIREGNAAQTAELLAELAKLAAGGADPAVIAENLAELLGPDLGGQVADELATRLTRDVPSA